MAKMKLSKIRRKCKVSITLKWTDQDSFWNIIRAEQKDKSINEETDTEEEKERERKKQTSIQCKEQS